MSVSEAAASPAESIYQRFFDNLPDLIFILDGKGTFQGVHGDVHGVLGYTSEQLQGMNFLEISDVCPELTQQSPVHPFISQFSDPTCGAKTIKEFHLTVRSKSGEIRYLELNGTGLYDHSGTLTSIYVIARDYTMRQGLQARVDYLRHLNEQILNSMREGIIVLDIPDLRVLNVNRSG